MAKLYTKGTTVVDEVLSGAERYDIKENAGTAFKSNMQIVLATGVSVAGTAINAARLNNIENGIDAVDTRVDNLNTTVVDANNLLTTGGTTTAYTLTTTGAAALATGERFRVKFNATAGATPTLNRDSKGAKSLKYYDNTGAKQACTSSNIVANLITDVVYDGTDYVVLDPAGVSGGSGDGWTASTATWSYSSADSPTFVISINADMTTILCAGMRIKLTQTTTKYFIVTVVGSYSAGATLVTVYGGTDYTLANAAITNPYYSGMKAPFGFNLSKSKWSVVLTDSTRRQQTASGTTVYNLGSLSIVAPIGRWIPKWLVYLETSHSPSGNLEISASLSTANNTINAAMAIAVAGASTIAGSVISAEFPELNLAAKTTYYTTATDTWAASNVLYFLNDVVNMRIAFECAYL